MIDSVLNSLFHTFKGIFLDLFSPLEHFTDIFSWMPSDLAAFVLVVFILLVVLAIKRVFF